MKSKFERRGRYHSHLSPGKTLTPAISCLTITNTLMSYCPWSTCLLVHTLLLLLLHILGKLFHKGKEVPALHVRAQSLGDDQTLCIFSAIVIEIEIGKSLTSGVW